MKRLRPYLRTDKAYMLRPSEYIPQMAYFPIHGLVHIQEGYGFCVLLRNIRSPNFVCTLSESEREALEEGLRSFEAFVLRRCQILLAGARGER